MSSFTDYSSEATLKSFLQGSTYTPPATVYLALGTTATAPTWTKGAGLPWNFTEPSGSAYSRVALSTASVFHAAPSQPTNGYALSNIAPISSPAATGSWGTCQYVGIFDAASGGNLLFWGTISPVPLVNNGDTVIFQPDQIVVSLT